MKKNHNFKFFRAFKIFLIFGAFTFLSLNSYGQVSNYGFTNTSGGTYTSISGGTNITVTDSDQGYSNGVPIGFSFVFNNVTYTHAHVSTNGWLTFGTSATNNTLSTSTHLNNIATGTVRPIIAPLWDDLKLSSSTSGIKYLQSGSSPNRKLTIQYSNIYWQYDAPGTSIEFQVILSESTNTIQFIYNRLNGTGNLNFPTASIGIGGASGDYLSLDAVGNGASAISTSETNDLSSKPATGRTFTWTPPTPPTITSLGSSSGCAGSSITINGTNLTGATASNVKVGGTAVSSITSNSGTSIVAVLGSGTTGTVSVTTSGGTATSGASFTVNPLPATPTTPTSNSPQCISPGVTLTSVAPPAGITWYWQTSATGTSTTNSGLTTIVTTAGPHYLRAQNNTTGCWSTNSASITVVVASALTAVATTPSPTNATTGICYSGSGAVSSISWATVSGATSYDVYFGSGSMPGTFTANVTTNSYSTGTLVANTTYYWKVIPKNACGSTSGTPTNWSFTTSSNVCYCASSGSTDSDGITGIVFNTINNTGTSVNTAYSDYTSISTTLTAGGTYNLNIYVNTGGNYTNYQSVWIDWNKDGDFDDSGEFMSAGTALNVTNSLSSLCPLSIAVPAGAVIGSARMRIQSRYSAVTTSSCQTGFDGEVEDYSITIIAASPCTTPTSQPTALSLTPASTTVINGSFTAASPVPNNYLIVRSLSSVAPSPVNGTSYVIGASAGGYTVVDNDSNTTFSATGLSGSTLYYFYIFSYNSACTGGPLYNAVTPLTGNATTLSPSYCTPTVATASTLYIRNIKLQGTLNDVANTSTYSSSPSGYQDFTGLPKSIQAQGEGINVYTEGNTFGTWRAWVDWNKDGTFATTEEVYTNAPYTGQTADFGFIIPASTAAGDYRIRIRLRSASSSYTACDNFTGSTYGETEDYVFTVVSSCSALITSVTDGVTCGTGAVSLNATSSGSATEYRWYSSKTGNTLVGTSPTGTWVTPSLSTTTTYYVTAFNGCESVERTAIIARINPLPDLNFSNTNPIVCGEGDVVVISASGDVEEATLFSEKFDSGLGLFSSVNNDLNSTTITNLTKWRNTSSVYSPVGQIWFPVISSGIGGNTFAFATSDIKPSTAPNPVNNYLELTSGVNTMNFTSLNLSLRVFYSRYLPDNNSIYSGTFYRDDLTIEVYDGTSWLTVQNYAEDIGIGTAFKTLNFDLSAYVNKTNLKIRINHYSWSSSSLFFPGGVAIDDVKLSGKRPLNTAFTWTSSTPINVYNDVTCLDTYDPLTDGATTVYIKPDITQLETANYSITVSATLSNGCVASEVISVTNNTKLWNGGSSTDWNLATNWKPNGAPTIDNCIVISEDVIVAGTLTEAFGKNLIVKPTGDLKVNSGNSITIKDAVTVQTGGLFTLEDTASLVQEGATNTNSGIITVKRETESMKRYDFTYWSSPVSPQTLHDLSPATLADKYYSWNPVTQAWLTHPNGNTTMVEAKGYIVRAPQTFPINTVNPVDYVGTFIGKPNSGDITIDVKGNASLLPADYKWNLIGNPYPSAIDLDEFLTFTGNDTAVDGTLYLWTHNSAPSNAIPGDQTYNYTANDYATYNLSGGVGTKAATPDPLNPVLSNNFNASIPTKHLASGQSFFIRGLANTPVKFINDMRVKGENNQFFRSGNSNFQTNSITTEIEKNRFWLNIKNTQGAFNQTLIGYIQGATDGLDRGFDGNLFGGNYVSIYSITDAQKLTIQGRALPFNATDIVNLGIKTTIAGTFTINIDMLDGLFVDQDIFLKDNLLNTIHNLKMAPYSFTAGIGTFDNRFQVVYQNALSVDNPEFNPDSVIIYKQDKTVIVNAGLATINEVKVFDIQGRLIFDGQNINASEKIIKSLPPVDQVLIVQVLTTEGIKVTKKIIY